MRSARICIVGAGLAGLYAAWLLQRHGIGDYVILEARDGTGGRIASFQPPGMADRFDLGPAWYWPEYQPELHRLIDALGLAPFPQHEAGDMLVERAAASPPLRGPGYASVPASARLPGGMLALVDALRRELDPDRIVTGQAVRAMRRLAGCVELDSEDGRGAVATWRAEHVLLAVPPRLALQAIAFSPDLPPALARQWRLTATWMAPHAKYVAVYERPFWREQGLSGGARSAAGPLGEIHDASMPGGAAALFGFFALPAQERREMADDALRARCRAQLARLFGAQAAMPGADAIKDWAADPLTAAGQDLDAPAQHGAAPPAIPSSGPWQDCLAGIASEWSPRFPGYLAGAIDAAHAGVQPMLGRRWTDAGNEPA